MGKRIAILYICTGKYNLFFEGFYASAMEYFLVQAEKTFYVWTDDDHIADGLPNVKTFHKECAGFPADSLFRFEMFMQVEEVLKSYDYIYFFNANAMFLQPVGEEILPDETGLAMGIWPGRREHQHPCLFPYERNKNSLAYVAPYGKDYTYYMGGLNGGKADCYLDMIRTLCKNIRDDYNRGIIAKVHDESHINAYMRSHVCKQIGRNGFMMPEEWMKDSDTPSIIFRDKVLINPYFNKGRQNTLKARLIKGLKIMKYSISWYL